MGMSEAETRLKLIDPALAAAGWFGDLIEREYAYKAGRIRLIGEHTVRDAPLFADYVLRDAAKGRMLAVVEAKDEDHGPSDGLGQALGYAIDMDVPFAYSTNGNGIVEHDRLTQQVAELDEYPSPEQLRARLAAGPSGRGPVVVNRRGVEVPNPTLEPALAGSGTMRWYQERAVQAALDQILMGRQRALLSLATGTGKTFIALNIAWKLTQTGYANKVLFLADRKNLRDQAFTEFAPYGKGRAVASGGDVSLAHDIHFGIYQGLFAEQVDGRRLYEHYPSDYFDLVIIDECHRSGYGDWKVILEHFSQAFQLGMTATPKRSDSIDTFDFFAGENRDDEGTAVPAFEYSFARGIEDGYLATYRVRQVRTDIDSVGLHIEDEIDRGADLIAPEDAEIRQTYLLPQFEREIVVRDRTEVLCKHLAGLLRTWGVSQKTMVFCVTMEHAALVRDLLQNELGPETGKDLYAVRIVSEEHDSDALLEQFQLSSSTEPVVTTTVDLLTTGVNVPAVRNIVFMKPIGSPTVFKQIIGRGSRLDPSTGKEFFRIVDYTNATRLFDSWDIPSAGDEDIDLSPDDGRIEGRVVDWETQEPVAASVRLSSRMTSIAEHNVDVSGQFAFTDLPLRELTVQVAASGYSRRSVQVVAKDAGIDPLLIEMKRPVASGERLEINGVHVTIAHDVELTLGSGESVSLADYRENAKATLLELIQGVGELRSDWSEAPRRQALLLRLRERDVDPAVLKVINRRPDADEYDMLADVAFGEMIVSREERARAVSDRLDGLFSGEQAKWHAIVLALLDRYRLVGVDEIATAEVFGSPPFATRFGGVQGAVKMLGSADSVREMLQQLQIALYTETVS